jgi:hypothetical protein
MDEPTSTLTHTASGGSGGWGWERDTHPVPENLYTIKGGCCKKFKTEIKFNARTKYTGALLFTRDIENNVGVYIADSFGEDASKDKINFCPYCGTKIQPNKIKVYKKRKP